MEVFLGHWVNLAKTERGEKFICQIQQVKRYCAKRYRANFFIFFWRDNVLPGVLNGCWQK